MGKIIPALRYLLRIYRALPGSRKQRKRIFAGIQSCVRDFVKENPGADYKAIEARFGRPEQIAKNTVLEMEPEEILDLLDIRYKVVHILLATVTAVVLIWFGYVSREYEEHVEAVYGYGTIEFEGTEEIVYDRRGELN